jgi:hypothetical protein
MDAIDSRYFLEVRKRVLTSRGYLIRNRAHIYLEDGNKMGLYVYCNLLTLRRVAHALQ